MAQLHGLYFSTPETTNLARVARLILGPCTGVLCDVLTKEIPPSTLPLLYTTLVNKTKRNKFHISYDQEQIIKSGKYSTFDITLLCSLLRNLSQIPPHSNQWGNAPNQGDKSVSANIERIRLIRNRYVHILKYYISDTEFISLWQDIFDIVQGLEAYLGSSTVYQDDVVYIKTCCMDPEQESKYIEELLNLNKKIYDISEEIKRIENTCVPKNVREIYETDILKWKEDDKLFFETHSYPAILETVRNKPYITIVGVPGSGKTAMARHISLKLQSEGYVILPIRVIKDIETYSDPHNPQVFVIDDVLGVFGLDLTKFDMLTLFEDRIAKPVMPKTKIIMTCREIVYRNEKLSKSDLFKKENVVQLHSDENTLNDLDKQELLATYNLNMNLMNSSNLALSSNMFPYLCKLYSKDKEFQCYGSKFFMSPVPCILQDLDMIKNESKNQYASLVLLMINQNKLSEQLFNDNTTVRGIPFHDVKTNILGKCKVDKNKDNSKFIVALKEMEGTYTKKIGSEFTFIHDSMFEIVAYHFGVLFPEVILQYMSCDYIANYIKINSPDRRESDGNIKNENSQNKRNGNGEHCQNKDKEETAIDLCIELKETLYPVLAERLFKDIGNGELYTVFGIEALKHQPVLHAFFKVMEKKTYMDIHSTYLSELGKKYKIPREEYEQFGVTKNNYCKNNIHILLTVKCKSSEFQKHSVRDSVRAISWVIYHGHHHILKFIIDQIKKNTGSIDDLFKAKSNTNGKNESESDKEDEMVVSFDSGTVNDNEVTADDKGAQRMSMILSHLICCCGYRYAQREITIDACPLPIFDRTNESRTNTDFSETVIEEQFRLLCLSCYSGDLKTVQLLLEYVAQDAINKSAINDTWFWQDRPLTIACKFGYHDIFRELLNAGADVNFHSLLETPLTAACQNGNLSIVQHLLKNEANVNQNTYLSTPLTCASKSGHLDVVEVLIKSGAKVNVRMGDETPLTVACTHGHLNIAAMLIREGADVNLSNGVKTPLTAACECGNLHIIKLLLKNGADNNLQDENKKVLTNTSYLRHLCLIKRLITIPGVDLSQNDLNESSLISKHGEGHLYFGDENVKFESDNNIHDDTPLIVACYNGNLNAAQELIKAKADVNKRSECITPLLAACYGGHSVIVKELIEEGADVTPIDNDDTGLTGACYFGHLRVVKELIKSGIDVNYIYNEETPLTVACYMGRLHLVEELIRAGAKVNLCDGDKTPLTASCYNGHLNVIEILLKAGADINQVDKDKTPLTVACFMVQCNVVETLIKAGAKRNLRDKKRTPLTTVCYYGHSKVVEQLLNVAAEVNLSDGVRTPLTAASFMGHFDVVILLLNAGANIDQSDGDKTPLTAACNSGHLDIVEYLIEENADVNLRDAHETPLTTSCYNGNLDIVCKLIQAKASVNEIDSYKTPLTAACYQGHLKVVRELLKGSADANQSDNEKTPLLAACYQGHLEIVKELINAWSDVNLKCKDKFPLIVACSEGNFEIAKKLIKAGASVNQRDKENSPLTAACYRGHLEIVKELISAGASVNLAGRDNTPLTVACYMGHLSVAEELINAKADVNLSNGTFTPLFAACDCDNLNLIKLLLKAGADVNSKKEIIFNSKSDQKHLLIVKRLEEMEIDIRQNDDQTPLFTISCANGNLCEVEEMGKQSVIPYDEINLSLLAACYNGHLNVVQELINLKADVNHQNNFMTPLLAACYEGHSDIVKELIKDGADVNPQTKDDTALTGACYFGHLNVVKVLIKARANVNYIYGDETPLTVASYMGRLLIVEELIRAGATVNLCDGDKTPLTAACYKGKFSVVETLMNAGSEVNLKDNNNTPLSVACFHGHFKVVEYFIKNEADINQRSGSETPLTAACANGHPNIVKFLIANKADINLSNGERTPLTAASYSGHLNVVKILIKAEADINLKDNKNTPLTAACEWGYLNVVKFLTECGADVNLCDGLKTPLTTACYWGHLPVIKHLIAYGANVHQKDRDKTPLDIAIDVNDVKIIRELRKQEVVTLYERN